MAEYVKLKKVSLFDDDPKPEEKPVENISVIPTPKNSNNLFELIDNIVKYEKREEFDTWSNLQLARNFFMVNRRMSIKYPHYACLLNHIGINEAEVCKLWRMSIGDAGMSKRYGGINFIYAKGAKKSESSKKKKSLIETITNDDRKMVANWKKLSLRDVEDLINFNIDVFAEYLEEARKYDKGDFITMKKK